MNNIESNKKLEACKLIPDSQGADKAACINSLIEVPQEHYYIPAWQKMSAFVGFLVVFFVMCLVVKKIF